MTELSAYGYRLSAIGFDRRQTVQTRPSPASGRSVRYRTGRQIETSLYPDHGRASASSRTTIQITQDQRSDEATSAAQGARFDDKGRARSVQARLMPSRAQPGPTRTPSPPASPAVSKSRYAILMSSKCEPALKAISRSSASDSST